MESYLKIYTNPNCSCIEIIEKFSRKLQYWSVKISYGPEHALKNQEIYLSDPKLHYKHDEVISELERLLIQAVTLGEKILFKEWDESLYKPLYSLRKTFNPRGLSKEDYVKENPVLTFDDVVRIVNDFQKKPAYYKTFARP